MNPDKEKPPETDPAERGDITSPPSTATKDQIGDKPFAGSAVNAHLEDALERVAHGATVSFPSILFKKGLYFVSTAILTNGFAASLYGFYVLARRLQSYLRSLASGFMKGLSRFLPTASPKERDVFATISSFLLLAIGTVFGTGLFITAPHITQVFDHGYQFQVFLRVFSIGLPLSLWLRNVHGILKGLEDVGALNLLFRFGLPIVQLIVVGIGTFIFQDLVAVAWGVVLTTAIFGLVLTGWLARARGFTPRVRGATAAQLRRRYVRFSLPLVVQMAVVSTERKSYYLLVLIFLSGVAGGVFAVGVLVGSLVKLPLVLNNQFMAPVVADLHENNHRDALVRLYQVTSRLILVGITGIAIPLLVYAETIMRLFGSTFVAHAALLPGFILASYTASAAGSVAIILQMTDHQRALVLVDTITALFVIVTAIPLTVLFGLRGLVVSYFLSHTVNNSLEIVALYYLDGFHPFTYLHMKPLLAGVPFLVIALVGKHTLSWTVAPLVGSLVGFVVYGTILYKMGFTTVERRLVRSLLTRYRETVSIPR